jgi:hypothetical protein
MFEASDLPGFLKRLQNTCGELQTLAVHTQGSGAGQATRSSGFEVVPLMPRAFSL